jgi:hypothetical protein
MFPKMSKAMPQMSPDLLSSKASLCPTKLFPPALVDDVRKVSIYKGEISVDVYQIIGFCCENDR